MSKTKDDDGALVPVVPANITVGSIDDYSDLKLSDGAKQKLAAVVLNAGTGLISITPLICAGPDDCPFSNRCPIYMADGSKGDYPLKKQCIVELNLARERFMAYVEEFNLQGKVEESPTLRSQISKLADFDIYEYRIKLILAGVAGDSDGSLLIEQSIAVTQGGADVLQIQEHPAWKMLERVQKQRMELLDALGATPKRKVWMDVALKRTDSDNLLAKQRELLERIDGLVEAMEEEK